MSGNPQEGGKFQTIDAPIIQDKRPFFSSAGVIVSTGDKNLRDEHYENFGSSSAPLSSKRVAIVLSYFEGKDFIADQLSSIFTQTFKDFHLFLCDDCSKVPFTIKGLNLGSEQLSKMSIAFRNRNIGYAANFLDALSNVNNTFEYYALSDQDDIWYENKLERAIAKLAEVSDDVPALYCARTENVDANCVQTLGYSPWFKKPPSFANSLVQNIAGGNTIVFNKAAYNLIIKSLPDITIVSHDWWCYQLVIGAGGVVIYDPQPCLKYRQHSNNLIGANSSWAARFFRIRGLIEERFRGWNDMNVKALLDNNDILTEQTLCTLEYFIEARQSHLFKRLMLFKRSGIHRQTLLGNLGLFLGVLLNKV